MRNGAYGRNGRYERYVAFASLSNSLSRESPGGGGVKGIKAVHGDLTPQVDGTQQESARDETFRRLYTPSTCLERKADIS